jgi:APA family basic amino acid/polyamine antiporter
VWFVAPAAVLSCGFLMYQLPKVTWIRFGIWLAVGLVFYFLYGYRKSALNRSEAPVPPVG